MTLTDLIPDPPDPDSVFEAFTGWVTDRGLSSTRPRPRR